MPTPPVSDETLRETVDAYIRCNYNIKDTILDLRSSYSTVKRHLAEAQRRGIGVPNGEIVSPPPLGYEVKGTSTLVDADGTIKAQWVKTDASKQAQQEALEAAMEALAEKVPRAKPLKGPGHTLDRLCNVYTLTDCHVGMLAWHREAGEDWDLKIAEETLVGCFEVLVAQAPKAHTGVVAQLGDFLHWDGLEAITPTGGHNLDADGRFEKVVKVAIRILRRVIDFALRHHEHVHVLMAEGNHDIASSVWLRQLFDALYENEPRVTVDTSPLPYYAFQWGKTALFWHHGHKAKADKLPLLFAAQFPQIWGETKKRYGHKGHYHSEELKEYSGLKMRQHATLAARDAYAARGGWISDREIKRFTYHKDFGEAGSETVTPEMLDVE